MNTMTVYRSTRNSQGIDEVVLKIDGDKIIGEGNFLYSPPAVISSIGRHDDWRTNNMFLNREDAIADYVALEKSRIRAAQNAIDAAEERKDKP